MLHTCKRLVYPYRLLDDADGEDKASDKSQAAFSNRARPTSLRTISISCVAFICLVLGLAAGLYLKTLGPSSTDQADLSSTVCKSPSLRREWRSLDRTEKRNYIEAVKCLKKKDSRLDLNQTLYDDFPWVHQRFGEYCTSPLQNLEFGCQELTYTNVAKPMMLPPSLCGTATSSTPTSIFYKSCVATRVISRTQLTLRHSLPLLI